MLGTEVVLSALAASKSEQRDISVQSPREISEQSGGFVVGMRGYIEDACGDAGAVDSFDGFRKAGTCSWSRRKLRGCRLRRKKREHGAEKCWSNGSKEKTIHAASASFI